MKTREPPILAIFKNKRIQSEIQTNKQKNKQYII
jgi:hypothetical protein